MVDLFSRLRISQKLPLLMVGLTALAISVMGGIAFLQSKAALVDAAEQRLMATLMSRRSEMSSLFSAVRADLGAQASNPLVIDALRSFKMGWRILGDGQKDHLRDWYVTKNDAEGGLQNLEIAEDRSRYSQSHRKFHTAFLARHKATGYGDIFLLDMDGNVVYSVLKGEEFAANVVEDSVAGPLGALFERLSSKDTPIEETFVVAPAAENGGIEACLVGKFVRDLSGNPVGLLVFSLPDAAIRAILERRSGLDQTGTMRLTSWVMNEAKAEGDQSEPRPIAQPMDTEEATFSMDQDLLSVTTDIHFMGATAQMIADETMAEILLPASALGQRFLLLGALSLAFISLIAVLLARSLSEPLQRVRSAMALVANSDFDTTVPDLSRKDEIGEIAKTLNRFKDVLGAAKNETADALFKGAAFEGSSAALMMVNRELVVTHLNDACRLLFEQFEAPWKKFAPNLDPKALLGTDFDEFNAVEKPAWQVLFGAENLPFHTEITMDDMRLSVNINGVANEEDHSIGYVIEWQDVSQDQKNRAIVSTIMAQQCMAEFDTSGQLLNANGAFREFSCAPEETLPNISLSDVFHAHEGQFRDLVQLGREGAPVFGRFRVTTGSGLDGILEGGVSPILDVNGDVVRMVLIARDITATEKHLEELDRERRRLEAAQANVVETLRVGLKSLSEGDLTVLIADQFSAEYDELRLDFNDAATKLRDAVGRVEENATAILNETAEIAGAAEDLSRRTETQASTLEETAAALDELTTSVKSSAAGAAQVSAIVDEARRKAEESGGVVESAVRVMGEIEASSGQISKIISVIDDIAFQTNLLALNAGVEAARAGDAGRGFAVVATEVRALAQRSSNAAREISKLISMSGQHVNSGVAQVGEAGEALERIVSSVTEIAGHISEIALSAQEQSNGLEEINSSVFQLDQVTQQNTAMFEETSAASLALRQEAEGLTATMAGFSTGRTRPSRGLDKFAQRDVIGPQLPKSASGLRTAS